MKNWIKKRYLFVIGITVIFIFTFSIFLATPPDSITASTQAVSEKKIEWGIKRNDNHEQPDLGSKNRELIEQYKGIAIGNPDQKYVYLTFDEGYEAGYTPKILEVLKQNEVKATFFITAHFLNTQEGLVKQMIEEGHIVGNHTVNHKSMPELSEEKIKSEVMDLHQAIFNKFNYEMQYIRPPKGEYSEKSLSVTNSLGYTTVMWSFAYDDWNEEKQGREEYAKKKILDNLHNGSVILLHGNSKDNANILDEMIKEIKKQGYTFRSLNEFVR